MFEELPSPELKFLIDFRAEMNKRFKEIHQRFDEQEANQVIRDYESNEHIPLHNLLNNYASFLQIWNSSSSSNETKLNVENELLNNYCNTNSNPRNIIHQIHMKVVGQPNIIVSDLLGAFKIKYFNVSYENTAALTKAIAAICFDALSALEAAAICDKIKRLPDIYLKTAGNFILCNNCFFLSQFFFRKPD